MMTDVAAPWDGDSNVLPFDKWRQELLYKADKQTLEPKDVGNFRLLMTHHSVMAGRVRLNMFTKRTEIGDVPWNRGKPMRPLEDTDFVHAREWLQRHGMQPRKDEARDALMLAARHHGYHPVRDYLEGLLWDGTPRLDNWLVDCLDVVDTLYSRIVAAKTLISAVARIMRPGCKVDTMLVIEGPQGLKKSSAVATLFGRDWFVESVSLFAKHDQMVMTMMGAWCIELAEFTAVRKGDQSTVKGLISTQKDRVKLPYAVSMSDHPRECIFVATINPGDSGYLGDDTGNRRYWPVAARGVALDVLTVCRDQLWAEAVHRFRAGERWWLEGEEILLAKAQQDDREEVDPWVDLLAENSDLHDKRYITSNDAMKALGIPSERRGKAVETRLGPCLRKAGWTDTTRRVDGKRTRMWRRKNDVYGDLADEE